MPAGLLAMTLGSSVDAAAPAKALPSAEALFSRNWNPVAQPSPIGESPIPAAAKEAESSLNFASTASSVIVNFFEDAAQSPLLQRGIYCARASYPRRRR